MADSERATLLQNRGALRDSWLCEALRLKETHWGQLDDRAACQRAACEQTEARQVAVRANILGETSGISLALERVESCLKVALVVLVVASVLVGSSTAWAALGAGLYPVNVFSALVLLLGVNLFSLALWLGTLFIGAGSGGGLAQGWQWLIRKLATGPEVALAGQAWWSIWQQAGGLRWVLGSLTHTFWLIASLTMYGVLLFTLSTRHFSFVWETTLLSADSFVALTRVLGAVPQWFGVAIPDSETVRASGHLATNSVQAQALWANWLLGALACYGILPRALVWIISLLMVARAWPRTRPQVNSSYYQALLARMQSTAMSPEGLPPDRVDPENLPPSDGTQSAAHAMLTGIELEGEWPPLGLDRAIVHTNMIDSRDSRNIALTQVVKLHPRRLVIACDARHTPDRGTLRLIAELSSYAGQTLVWLQPNEGPDSRSQVWKEQLQALARVEVLFTPLLRPVSDWLGDSGE